MELTEFRSRHEAAAADGIGIYGISVDSVFSHQAFAKELGGLPYDLIAAFDNQMVTDYGGIPRRTAFVIDGDGIIRWTWVTSREKPQPDYDLVIEEARKTIGESGV